MAVKIRLARHGAKKHPVYRVVVADGRCTRDGRYIEQVGRYNPNTDPSEITLDLEKVEEWIKKGAQPSDRVAKIIAEVKGEPLPKKIQARADFKAAEKAAAEKAAAEKAAAEAAAKAAEEAAEEE